MDSIILLFVLAVVVEALVTWLKELFKNGKMQWQVLVALTIGELFAFNYQVDLLAIFGAGGVVPYVGILATGVFLSRGAGYINELVSKLKDITKK